jgi:hypothetical protein
MRTTTNLKEIGEHAFSNLPSTIDNPLAGTPITTTGFMMPRATTITRLDSYCFSDNPTLAGIDGNHNNATEIIL